MVHRGRFGQVYKCVENSSGLALAAKIIKARSQKEKVIVVLYMLKVKEIIWIDV